MEARPVGPASGRATPTLHQGPPANMAVATAQGRCRSPSVIGSVLRFMLVVATRPYRRTGDGHRQLHHAAGVRHAKLSIACRWESDPAKAVAGRLGPSLAGVVVTRGPKCRQGPCRVRDRASKGGRSRRPSWLPNSEGSMCAVGRRDGVAPPGSKAGSRTEGDRRNMRGPPGSAGSRVRRIGPRRGMRARHCRRSHPSRGRESDRFIVPMKPSKETRRAAGRGRPEGSPREGARARTPRPGIGAGPSCRLTSLG
jgi:hypothetical protein